jgi:NAD(P)-dependent dehydrogenase (short-subunit alcohol dehydrogenase family)
MTMTVDLTGTRAVVTGAGRGIGRAEALALAGSGARVVVNYARSADAAAAVVDDITAAGGEAHAVEADMADPDAVTALMDRAADLLGGIDVLVSNAGIEHFGELGTVAADDVDRVFAINTRGQFLAVQAAQRHMGEGGRIICTSSIAAGLAVPGHALYAGSKAAVEAMVRCLALDLVGRGITVNAIAPGGTSSDMSAENGPHYANDLTAISWPMGRYGEPDDITPMVLFLAAPQSGWITGQTLRVSGGQ